MKKEVVERKPTISDVARLAGVSIATVSRVINNTTTVSEETKKKVEVAIQKLMFSPNIAASALRGGLSRVVGFISPRISNVSNMRIAAGIESVLSENGFSLFIVSSNNDPEKEIETLYSLQKRFVDAIIVSTSLNDPYPLIQIRNAGIPVVLVDRYMEKVNIPRVQQNGIEASYNITNHLIENGHRDIAVMNGPMRLKVAEDRFRGFRNAMNSAKLSIREDYILEGNYDANNAYNATMNMLREIPSKNLPTAIYVTSEQMTYGFFRAISEFGMKVPDDISIVSYGIVKTFEPFGLIISGVDHNYEELGIRAANLSLNLMESQQIQDDSCIIVDAEILLGNSVKKMALF